MQSIINPSPSWSGRLQSCGRSVTRLACQRARQSGRGYARLHQHTGGCQLCQWTARRSEMLHAEMRECLPNRARSPSPVNPRTHPQPPRNAHGRSLMWKVGPPGAGSRKQCRLHVSAMSPARGSSVAWTSVWSRSSTSRNRRAAIRRVLASWSSRSATRPRGRQRPINLYQTIMQCMTHQSHGMRGEREIPRRTKPPERYRASPTHCRLQAPSAPNRAPRATQEPIR